MDGEALVVRIRDAAPPFDPRSVPEPRLDLPLSQRPFGGMGIHLARTLTDAIDHRILPGGGNEVTVTKRLRPAADEPRGRSRRATMDITTERPSADLAVIALTGELDGSNFEQVIEAGRIAVAGGATRVVLDLGGLTYMGSSGLVAIHSIALIARGREPISPDDGWQAIHDIGSEADDEGPTGAVPRRARPVRRPRPRAQRDGEPLPRPRGPGRRDRRRLGLTAAAPAVAHASLDRLLDAAAIQPLLDAAARLIPGGAIGVEDADGAVVAAAGGERDGIGGRGVVRDAPPDRGGRRAGRDGRGHRLRRRSRGPRRRSVDGRRRAHPRRDRGRRPPRGRRPRPSSTSASCRSSPGSPRPIGVGGRPGPDRRLRPRRDRPAAPGRGRARSCPSARQPAGRRRIGDADAVDRLVAEADPLVERLRSADPDQGACADLGEPGPTDAFGSILAAVVRTTRGPQGAIVLGRAPEATPFDDPDRRLLAAVASQTAVALERATLQREILGRRSLDDELAIGRRIQRSLMPRRFPTCRAGRSRPPTSRRARSAATCSTRSRSATSPAGSPSRSPTSRARASRPRSSWPTPAP